MTATPTEFTPPFRATQVGASLIDANGTVVAHINGTGSQRKSTANQLAAAPEALAACKTLKPFAEAVIELFARDPEQANRRFAESVLEQATLVMAAIKKAEGVQ